MSEVKVNKLSPRSGTTVTLGDSGDTISIPSGVTLSNAGTNTFASATITGDLTVDTNTLFVDASANTVGIGTTAPTPPTAYNGLVINATYPVLKLTSATSGTGVSDGFTIRVNSADDAQLWHYENKNMSFATNNAERMRIDSSGNVGIKNTVMSSFSNLPATDLVVGAGTTNSGITIYSGTTHGSNIGFADGASGDARNQGIIQYHHNGNYMRFFTNASERVRIDNNSGDRLFIGTTSDLSHGSADNNRLIVSGHSNNGAGIIGFVDTSGNTDGTITANDGNLVITADTQQTASNSSLQFRVDNSEKMRINSSGLVGIGTSSPTQALSIASISSTPGDYKGLAFQSGSTEVGYVRSNCTDGNNYFLSFGTFSNGLAERMRIKANGTFLFGKTSSGTGVNGVEFESNGKAVFSRSGTSGGTPMFVNRNDNDGDLVSWRQDNVQVGSVSVSGNTVSYNAFTGSHWSRFQDNSTPTILKGTVLETLDEMCDWYNLEFDIITQDEDGNDVTTTKKIPHVLTDTQSNGDVITYNHEGTDYQATIVKEDDIKHMMSKVSDTVDAKNVYGVFSAYDLDGEGYNDFYVASVGSFVVRIKANETIAKGDLLQSNGDGTAKVQTDDAVRSSSFAKVLSTTIIKMYEDGSFIVPCSLMC